MQLKQCYLADHACMRHKSSKFLTVFHQGRSALSLAHSRFLLPFLITRKPLSSGLRLKKQSTPFFPFDYISLNNTIYFVAKTSQSCFVRAFPSSKSCLVYLYLRPYQPPDETHTGPSADKVSQATRYIHHSPT